MRQTLTVQHNQGYTKTMLIFNVFTRNGNDTQGIDDNCTYKNYLGERFVVLSNFLFVFFIFLLKQICAIQGTGYKRGL